VVPAKRRDAEKSNRVMNAMLQMTTIDIDGLRRAYDDRPR
jgi:hypothetical protein